MDAKPFEAPSEKGQARIHDVETQLGDSPGIYQLGLSKSKEPQVQPIEEEVEEDSTRSPAPSSDGGDVVPTTKVQFLVIFVALILAIFCVALDNTIIVTAIPRITDDYNTLNDVGW